MQNTLSVNDVTKYRTTHTAYTARTALPVDVQAGNWTFRPFVSSPPSLIQRFLLIFLLIQFKPKHHHLDVLTIFQCGAHGAVFRDTLSVNILTSVLLGTSFIDANLACKVKVSRNTAPHHRARCVHRAEIHVGF